MTPRFEIKFGTDDDGGRVALFRYASDDDVSGCWYSVVEKAEQSWNRRHPEDQITVADPTTLAGALHFTGR